MAAGVASTDTGATSAILRCSRSTMRGYGRSPSLCPSVSSSPERKRCSRSTLTASVALSASAVASSRKWSNSLLSISRSIPVILPASLGYISWMRGYRRSPNMRFCCDSVAAASTSVKECRTSPPGGPRCGAVVFFLSKLLPCHPRAPAPRPKPPAPGRMESTSSEEEPIMNPILVGSTRSDRLGTVLHSSLGFCCDSTGMESWKKNG